MAALLGSFSEDGLSWDHGILEGYDALARELTLNLLFSYLF